MILQSRTSMVMCDGLSHIAFTSLRLLLLWGDVCLSVPSELVRLLQDRGVKVFLVSGGFHCLIRPVAQALNIPAENITANRLLFDFYGRNR